MEERKQKPKLRALIQQSPQTLLCLDEILAKQETNREDSVAFQREGITA